MKTLLHIWQCRTNIEVSTHPISADFHVLQIIFQFLHFVIFLFPIILVVMMDHVLNTLGQFLVCEHQTLGDRLVVVMLSHVIQRNATGAVSLSTVPKANAETLQFPHHSNKRIKLTNTYASSTPSVSRST
jgi:hypothetical protein